MSRLSWHDLTEQEQMAWLRMRLDDSIRRHKRQERAERGLVVFSVAVPLLLMAIEPIYSFLIGP